MDGIFYDCFSSSSKIAYHDIITLVSKIYDNHMVICHKSEINLTILEGKFFNDPMLVAEFYCKFIDCLL